MTDDNTADAYDTTEKLERTDTGISLTVKMSRGTGTNDRDKITGKLKEETMEAAEEQRDDLVALVQETAEDVRNIDPDRDTEEEQ